ncbi:hypothetical protein ACFL5T_04645 [Gemmatimonadota bacterium]
MAKRRRTISVRDAIRSLYIDLEGPRNGSPVILGVLYQQDFEQYVLDPDFWDAPRKETTHREYVVVAEELIQRCKDEDRKLVAYGYRERTSFRNDLNLDISEYYVNAHLIVKDWIKASLATELEGYRLRDALKLVGYERVEEGQIQTRRLNDVRIGLRSRGPLTGTQKGKWTRLLKHNRVDCQSMRDLMLLAASR